MKNSNSPMHIAIAGNIGAGKTTLAGILAKHYGWEAHYEEVDGNPYLDDFYHDMQRWSFNLQVYFLNNRFSQIIDFRHAGRTVIQDRTIYEDAEIFAPNLHEMGLMSTRDFATYHTLFDLMGKLIQAPDLIIYLRASIPTLVNQIQKRGRDYENTIRLDYLLQLNQRYEAWASRYRLGKMLIINVDELNFAENKEDTSKVIDRIDAQLHGLF